MLRRSLRWRGTFFTVFGRVSSLQDPAFFTGRKLIIQWVNDTFHMNVSKIEETASGERGGLCAGV